MKLRAGAAALTNHWRKFQRKKLPRSRWTTKIFPLWPLVASDFSSRCDSLELLTAEASRGRRNRENLQMQNDGEEHWRSFSFSKQRIKWIKLRFLSLVSRRKQQEEELFYLLPYRHVGKASTLCFSLSASVFVFYRSQQWVIPLSIRKTVASFAYTRRLFSLSQFALWSSPPLSVYACKNFLAPRLELVSCRIETARSFFLSLFVDFRASQEVVNYLPR